MSRESESGMMVYPKLPVPQRGEEPRVKGFKNSGAGGNKTKWIAGVVAAALIGGAAGFFLTPSHKAELDKAKVDLAAAQKAATVEKDRADGLDKQLAVVKKDKDDAEAKLAEVSTKQADQEKKIADAEAEKKLKSTVDASQGTVSTEGDEIHLKLVDKVLFAVGDDKLTDKGKQVLDKVAVALKDLSDKQVWVQGHTDDQPIYIPPQAKKPPPPPKGKVAKGKEPPKEPDAALPFVRFPTNWELSAARALTVVHYLQDTAKIDPSRLAALAFGQYRPVSKRDKAANRRIEIVLVPKKAILEKDKR